LVAPTGVATGDTSDRLLHSETFQTRALALRRFPAQRPLNSSRCLSAPSRGSLSCRTLRPVLVLAKSLLSRLSTPVRRRAQRASGGSGPPDANEAGESRVSRRDSHFGDRCGHDAMALSSIERDRVTTSDTPVASSSFVGAVRWCEIRASTRRPPRPVPRRPRERRALPRSEVPSFGSDLVQPARTGVRTNPRCLRQSHGVHVMWIAWLRRIAPSSPGVVSCACARCDPLWLSPRSRAPWQRAGFRPARYR